MPDENVECVVAMARAIDDNVYQVRTAASTKVVDALTKPGRSIPRHGAHDGTRIHEQLALRIHEQQASRIHEQQQQQASRGYEQHASEDLKCNGNGDETREGRVDGSSPRHNAHDSTVIQELQQLASRIHEQPDSKNLKGSGNRDKKRKSGVNNDDEIKEDKAQCSSSNETASEDMMQHRVGGTTALVIYFL